MKDIIDYFDFEKVDIRIGTIIEAEENNSLKKPSIVLKIDFGKQIGIKKSSAQLKKNYLANNLINKQVAAVVNFEPKQIGNMISEVLVVGFPDDQNEPVLMSPDFKIKNGGKLF
ncbi:MAG: tRNA-binding protein [Rickettsiales bacterium]|nr:tRNA-binding protein [Rickettsiales bacterium]|tara:strand:+ start:10795 stop:11136 length:342 start_codon:yes stop_codon:yes gene_type:complete